MLRTHRAALKEAGIHEIADVACVANNLTKGHACTLKAERLTRAQTNKQATVSSACITHVCLSFPLLILKELQLIVIVQEVYGGLGGLSWTRTRWMRSPLQQPLLAAGFLVHDLFPSLQGAFDGRDERKREGVERSFKHHTKHEQHDNNGCHT